MKPPPADGKQSIRSSRCSSFYSISSNTYHIFVFLLVNILICILALTGFVCTHKIQAEEECLSSNILCYECDSRYDPNCADPFEFPAWYQDQQHYAQQPAPNTSQLIATNNHARSGPQQDVPINSENSQDSSTGLVATTNNNNSTLPRPPPKKLPAATVCHGCCVKITSKTLEGTVYVKRTCTTNLQINYFMVGLVCMKESGDRGKMCFCETDYCNGQSSTFTLGQPFGILIWVLLATILMTLLTPSSIRNSFR